MSEAEQTTLPIETSIVDGSTANPSVSAKSAVKRGYSLLDHAIAAVDAGLKAGDLDGFLGKTKPSTPEDLQAARVAAGAVGRQLDDAGLATLLQDPKLKPAVGNAQHNLSDR
ncbi:hypothetical protein COY07_01905 [Candidatus Peregrinibacteria bacterium CG_4_10_14_0_2_um_filter_43_11]|nr:MAG: hypothetical protein COY07_01905 [Candidatus Peregrinibacteria bacterium CG_4_10_14_0_2_um_filter_43_11]